MRFVNQYAVLLTVGYNYIGAQADINVWNPVVDLGDDYTTAQIWLNGGPGDRVESVESGWMVSKLFNSHLRNLIYTISLIYYADSGKSQAIR